MSAQNTRPEDGRILNQTSRGTPMGELLRRYWWPIGISEDLKDKPTLVRLLGEDLALFRDPAGRLGLLGAMCPHRLANLCLGNVVKTGLQCRYHGWVFDREGKVLATPGEPDHEFKNSVRHLSYLVEELGGIVFAYLGPKPAPALPRFNFLAAPGERQVKITGFAKCNWLPTIENGMDPIHLSFTHAPSLPGLRNPPEVWFEETDWGIAYFSSRPTPDRSRNHVRIHNLLLPGMSCTGSLEPFFTQSAGSDDTPISARWAVPIDDENTMMVRVIYKPADHPGEWRDRSEVPDEVWWSIPWESIPIEPYLEYRTSDDDQVELGYHIPRGVTREDAAVCESIGRQIDHGRENLMPTGDWGLSMVRQVYLDGVAAVAAGRDPKGVVRDPGHDIIRPLVGERFVSDTTLAEMRTHPNIATNLSSTARAGPAN